MPFQPKAHQELTIDGVLFRCAEHPNAPGIPHAQEGNSAVVYQLEAQEDQRALKVFHPRFRALHLVSPLDQIASLASLPGLQVCQRTILTPSRHAELLRSFPGLIYAVLMPWVEGPTWQTVLLSRNDPSWPPFNPEQSLSIAHALARVLLSMEERGIAHCDLSASNLIFSPDLSQATAALVDVEGIYAPRLSRPELPPAGSPGYAHQTASQGLWNVKADRFAGAVLLAEILGWSSDKVRQAAWGESYFQAEETQRDNERYQILITSLRMDWGDAIANLLTRAWHADTVAECPTLGEWLVALPDEAVAPTVEVSKRAPKPDRTADLEISQLILQAVQATSDGELDTALALYHRAARIAPTKLATDLENRIRSLEEQRREVAGWACPHCGEQVAPELETCPQCGLGRWEPVGPPTLRGTSAKGKRSIVILARILGGTIVLASLVGLTGLRFGWWPLAIWQTPTPTATQTAAPTTTLTASPTLTLTPTPTTEPTVTQTPSPTPTATQTPTLAPGDTWMRPGDTMTMAYVPAGEFEMGSTEGASDERPVHTIRLNSFWIDRTEVTNTQYRQCAEAGVCEAPTECDWGIPTYEDEAKADHPAVCVDWFGAQAYCEWAGGRLPTEAEWEYAARGPAHNTYPWGDTFDGELLNYCDANCEYDHRDSTYDDRYEMTAPVGSYSDGASWCGALDMAGNVWEWAADRYDNDYYADSPSWNPTGPSAGDYRVLRGGSWTGLERNVRSADRDYDRPYPRYHAVGFRCVSTGPEG